jgi:two-component system cell cycle response regulator
MKVLIVDDNPLSIEFCREILDGECDVFTACEGQEAVRLVGERDPDFVLLDVMLPGIDGYETCRQIRALPTARRIKIIMLSAKAMPAERAEGIKAGADAYITKPFSDAEILKIVRSMKSASTEG